MRYLCLLPSIIIATFEIMHCYLNASYSFSFVIANYSTDHRIKIFIILYCVLNIIL